MKAKAGKDTFERKSTPDNFQNKKRMISHDYHHVNLLQAVPLGHKIFGYVHCVGMQEFLDSRYWTRDAGRFSDYTNNHIRTPRNRI